MISMIRKCLKKAAALAAALMMALMFIPAGAYAVYAADAGNTVVVGVNADYGISAVGGNYTGYAFDFLREIQKRSDLTFTFVEGTAPELASKIAKGEVDVIPCVSSNELDAWQGMTSAAEPTAPLRLPSRTFRSPQSTPRYIFRLTATYRSRITKR